MVLKKCCFTVGKDKPSVHWKERKKEAIGIAEVLNYLHDGCSHPIIHRDVKSSNIFLSEDFEPQLLIFVRNIISQDSMESFISFG